MMFSVKIRNLIPYPCIQPSKFCSDISFNHVLHIKVNFPKDKEALVRFKSNDLETLKGLPSTIRPSINDVTSFFLTF